MDYYFAGMENGEKEGNWQLLLNKFNHRNILLSYYYVNKLNFDFLRENNFNILLDSGAFTAFTLKKEIKIDNYIAFLHANRWIENFLTLDVIGNADKTFENFSYIKSNGLNAIPVFHMDSDMRHLHRLIDSGCNYIALGGMAVNSMKNRSKIISFCKRCFDINITGIKFHGLGIGSPSIINMFDWHSVDSTSWLTTRKYLRHPLIARISWPQFKTLSTSEKSRFAIGEILKWISKTKEIQKIKSDFVENSDLVIKEYV